MRKLFLIDSYDPITLMVVKNVFTTLSHIISAMIFILMAENTTLTMLKPV